MKWNLFWEKVYEISTHLFQKYYTLKFSQAKIIFHGSELFSRVVSENFSHVVSSIYRRKFENFHDKKNKFHG